ncbi:hypothetical protein L1987_62674 [Smallanthus sonchifolius]|uniref:Uncharacterized protein n=1 Tax=Smallanthus sonchifolius TaxID=185202 RepID=A0ACB9CB50_9ASTR|nr:hypothetical protein L1987_62674 [Smallanthus sonchifolius]
MSSTFVWPYFSGDLVIFIVLSKAKVNSRHMRLELWFSQLPCFEPKNQNAVKRLWEVSKLINQPMSNALSGLPLVEAILQHMGCSIDKWNALYSGLPSRQLKEL